MQALRRYFWRHRTIAAWLIAVTLLLRAVLPAGYMIGGAERGMTIQLCTGYGAQTIVVPLDGEHQDHEQAADKQPCAFAGAALPSLGAIDPILLAIALAFILAAAFDHRTARAIIERAWLRPPLRGPPATL